jgi:hypothetical protein
LAAIFFVVCLFIAAVLISGRSPRNPANFRIDDSYLVILNDENEELWRYDTGIPNLNTDEEYRKRFQYPRRINGQDYLPHLIIHDIDQDGKSDILFSTQTQDEYGEGNLIFFDHSGKIKWKFSGGKELSFGNSLYSADYRISGFSVFDFNNDGSLKIVVISSHRHFYPTQLSILNTKGELIGEYWNSGRLSDIEVVDLEGDGKVEMIVSGCNNEYGNACLIVFDPYRVEGCSFQSDSYRSADYKKGTEKYYILFPRTELDILISPVEYIMAIEKLKNNRLSLRTRHSQIIFELNYNLEINDVRLTHTFEINNADAIRNGKITEIPDEEYLRRLKEGLLYFDGNDWSSEPTIANYW